MAYYGTGVTGSFFADKARAELTAAQMQYVMRGNYEAQISRTAGINYAINKAAEQGMEMALAVSLNDIFSQVTSIMNYESEQYLSNLGKLAKTLSRQRRAEWKNAFDVIGSEATKATVNRYKKVHASRRRGTSAEPYRANESGPMHRYAGKVLENALSSKAMYLARPDGLSFVNVSFLDSRAKQWARLNFGVSPRGDGGGIQGDLGQFQKNVKGLSRNLSFGNVQTSYGDVKKIETDIRFGFSSIGPRDPMVMPQGLWYQGGFTRGGPDRTRRGFDQFSPGGPKITRGSKVTTQGVAAWGFLNAGVAVIANNVPSTIQGLVIQGIQEAFEGNTSQLAVKAKVPVAQINEIVAYTDTYIQSATTRKALGR